MSKYKYKITVFYPQVFMDVNPHIKIRNKIKSEILQKKDSRQVKLG